ncbi:glycosyltransferase family 4 protein [Pseudonocardia sp. TRM90224]|uniref:glycosyltransferase family 4 protein n=1 Tax=Pseudonocardia sp. TRM90224 TaxID=2812678 RepID=UPI001E396771|nr:glycosyltransferase family 4 protein [Pseudonocardia sp. TRM90224]
MRVLIVGGVFGRDDDYRRSINPTPEMTLSKGLRERGVDVVTAGHIWRHRLDGIDVVHVHHVAKSLPLLAGLRPLHRVPLVFTRHNEERTLPAARAASLWLMNRAADAMVALSHQEAARLRTQVRCPVTVIRNGIDAPERVTPPVRPADGEPWRFLYAGQLIPRKGIDVLLRAMAAIRATTPVALRLVFHNPGQLAELQALAGQLGLADAVEFVGRKDVAGMAAEYERTNVLVLPSRAEAESLPSVITESLLANRPVVATDDAGVPEQVLHGGVLARPGDVDDMAAAIQRLVADYDMYAEGARKRSDELHPEYDVVTMIDRHLEVYESVVAGRRVMRRAAR